jgi:hypothetical protein
MRGLQMDAAFNDRETHRFSTDVHRAAVVALFTIIAALATFLRFATF